MKAVCIMGCSALLGMLLAGSTYAAHPLITDDVGTQGRGKFQLEVNTEFAGDEEAEEGVTIEERGIEASTVISLGISEYADIVIGLPFVQAEVREDGTTVFDEQGISDASLEVKWRFFEAEGTSLAIKPGVIFPTGNGKKGLGAGKYGITAFLIGTQEAGAFTFHANAGYVRNSNRAGEEENLWHASFASEWKVSGTARIVANIGAEKNAEPASKTDPAFALVGLIYALSENMDIDFGYIIGVNNAETDQAILAGTAFRF